MSVFVYYFESLCFCRSVVSTIYRSTNFILSLLYPSLSAGHRQFCCKQFLLLCFNLKMLLFVHAPTVNIPQCLLLSCTCVLSVILDTSTFDQFFFVHKHFIMSLFTVLTYIWCNISISHLTTLFLQCLLQKTLCCLFINWKQLSCICIIEIPSFFYSLINVSISQVQFVYFLEKS